MQNFHSINRIYNSVCSIKAKRQVTKQILVNGTFKNQLYYFYKQSIDLSGYTKYRRLCSVILCLFISCTFEESFEILFL